MCRSQASPVQTRQPPQQHVKLGNLPSSTAAKNAISTTPTAANIACVGSSAPQLLTQAIETNQTADLEQIKCVKRSSHGRKLQQANAVCLSFPYVMLFCMLSVGVQQQHNLGDVTYSLTESTLDMITP